MELDKLRYFKPIAELENISRVAKEVNIAQSALSRMLKSLADLISEEELNADYIIPKAFDPRVKDAVAAAVAKAAIESGVGRA